MMTVRIAFMYAIIALFVTASYSLTIDEIIKQAANGEGEIIFIQFVYFFKSKYKKSSGINNNEKKKRLAVCFPWEFIFFVFY